jgi:hypothetical protein
MRDFPSRASQPAAQCQSRGVVVRSNLEEVKGLGFSRLNVRLDVWLILFARSAEGEVGREGEQGEGSGAEPKRGHGCGRVLASGGEQLPASLFCAVVTVDGEVLTGKMFGSKGEGIHWRTDFNRASSTRERGDPGCSSTVAGVGSCRVTVGSGDTPGCQRAGWSDCRSRDGPLSWSVRF